MNLSQTLELLRKKEKANVALLHVAMSLKRYRERSDQAILRRSEAFYLPAHCIRKNRSKIRVFEAQKGFFRPFLLF